MILGGRVKAILCGGAVLSEETQRFVQAALCVKLLQGYGLTETCAAGTVADRLYPLFFFFFFVKIFIYCFLLKNLI